MQAGMWYGMLNKFPRTYEKGIKQMADFLQAVDYVLAQEGGLVENENDAGQITNYGISFRYYKTINPYAIENDIRNLTVAQAKEIYLKEFWNQAPFDHILNQEIATYLFDCCVNHGIAVGIKLLQRACWPYYRDQHSLVDDGVLASKTIHAITKCHMVLPYTLMAERAGYYRMLAAINPKDATFLNGWLKRSYNWPS